jgi:hypothetical protein
MRIRQAHSTYRFGESRILERRFAGVLPFHFGRNGESTDPQEFLFERAVPRFDVCLKSLA